MDNTKISEIVDTILDKKENYQGSFLELEIKFLPYHTTMKQKKINKKLRKNLTKFSKYDFFEIKRKLDFDMSDYNENEYHYSNITITEIGPEPKIYTSILYTGESHDSIRVIEEDENVTVQFKGKNLFQSDKEKSHWKYFYNNYGSKITLSNEITLNETEYNIEDNKIYSEGKSYTKSKQRNITRYSYKLSNFARLDLSKVTEKGFSKRSTDITIYEIELEFIGDLNNADEINDFLNTMENVLKMIHFTEVCYSRNEYFEIVKFFNSTLSSEPWNNRESLNHKISYNLRDLMFKDLLGSSDSSMFDLVVQEDGTIHPNSKETVYRYRVGHKADGERKYLITHRSGLWLLSPSFKVNKLIDYPLNGFENYIVECEHIGNHNLYNGLKVYKKYTLLMFDCLSTPREEESEKGDITIQSKYHNDRLFECNKLSVYLNDLFSQSDLIETRTKRFIEFNNAEELFKVCNNLIIEQQEPMTGYQTRHSSPPREEFEKVVNVNPDEIDLDLDQLEETSFITGQKRIENYILSDKLFYKTDGLVIIPNEMGYIVKNSKRKFKNLSKYPDMCKWKPKSDRTIDLAVTYSNGNVELFVTKNSKFGPKYELLTFKGNKFRHRFDKDIMNFFENLPDKIVVEFRIEPDFYINLVPTRIRFDKSLPNSQYVVDKNFNLAINSITEDSIRGEGGLFFRKVHNEQKREMYRRSLNNTNQKNLLDIGSGIGSMVDSYNDFDKVLLVEPNDSNFEKLINRMEKRYGKDKIQVFKYYEDLTNPFFNIGNIDTVKFFIIKTDGQDYPFITAVLERYFNSKVDVISFFFTIHFMVDELEESLYKLISKFHGEHLQILTFNVDSESVYYLFDEHVETDLLIDSNFLDLKKIGTIEFDRINEELAFNLKFVTITEQYENLFSFDKFFVDLKDNIKNYDNLTTELNSVNSNIFNKYEEVLNSLYKYSYIDIYFDQKKEPIVINPFLSLNPDKFENHYRSNDFGDDDVDEIIFGDGSDIIWKENFKLMNIKCFHGHLSFYYAFLKAINEDFNNSTTYDREQMVEDLFSDMTNFLKINYNDTIFEDLYFEESMRVYGNWNIVHFLSMNNYDENVINYISNLFNISILTFYFKDGNLRYHKMYNKDHHKKICILTDGTRYNLMGLNTEDGIQTCFSNYDKFIIKNMYEKIISKTKTALTNYNTKREQLRLNLRNDIYIEFLSNINQMINIIYKIPFDKLSQLFEKEFIINIKTIVAKIEDVYSSQKDIENNFKMNFTKLYQLLNQIKKTSFDNISFKDFSKHKVNIREKLNQIENFYNSIISIPEKIFEFTNQLVNKFEMVQDIDYDKISEYFSSDQKTNIRNRIQKIQDINQSIGYN